MRKVVQDAGLSVEVDSAGTGAWHIGEAPDPRAISTAARQGVAIGHYQARQIEDADYTRFTHILALDHDNLSTVKARAPLESTAAISLLLDHVPGREGQAVADPYYGAESGFAETWDDVFAAARSLLAKLQ